MNRLAGVNFRSRRTGKWMRGAFIAEKATERQEGSLSVFFAAKRSETAYPSSGKTTKRPGNSPMEKGRYNDE